MMNLKSSLCAVALVLAAVTFTKCTAPATADQLHKEEKWAKAVDKLIDDLAKEKNDARKAQMTYMIAENYMGLRKYDLAAQWYENAEKVNYAEAHPELLLKLADAYKGTCRYDEALKRYNEYLKRVPNDKAALNGAKACELAVEWEKKPTRYEVTNVVMLNTANDDAAPIFMNKKKYNQILFYSYRSGTTGAGESEILGEAFPDLFQASLDAKGKWTVPAIVPGDANSEFAEGASAFDMKGKKVYFTRCDLSKKNNAYCAIFVANGDDKKLEGSVKVPLAADTFLVAQPALSADGSKLYFVSDMTGGEGGKDIWVASYNKETKMWENPTNLGAEVNTAGDELFPFVHADGTLYFSSNGHIGIGGFDLFKAAASQSSFGPVINLKVPLNSCGDDVAIIFEDKAERGYVTSNRLGTKGGLDIWSFALHPLEVKCDGIVVENDGKKTPVKGAKVTANVSDGSKQEFVSDSLGKFGFALSVNLNYTLAAASDAKYTDGDVFKKGKAKYLRSKNLLLSTVGVDDSKTYECMILLDTIPVGGIELPNIEYEYNKSVLTPTAKISLNTLIEVLNENPTLSIELGSHTDFRGSADYNRKLAQARAESAVRYLVEKGIDPNRMKAKGFGEDKPKLITKENFKFVPDKYKSVFPSGTLLDEKFINSLKSKDLTEAAHQLNRRTEFQILCSEWEKGKNAECK